MPPAGGRDPIFIRIGMLRKTHLACRHVVDAFFIMP
jgi:hypothetical protein